MRIVKNDPAFQPLQLTSQYRKHRVHRRSHSLPLDQISHLSPSNAAQLSHPPPTQHDLIITKSKKKVKALENDIAALIHATEQLSMAQQLKDLSHKVMIDTLRNLKSSLKLKKKGNELSDLLYSEYLKETQRTECWTDNLLDTLLNVQNTHNTTSTILQEEYNKAHESYVSFSEKHPEVDVLSTPSSNYSTDEEISDSSILSTGALSTSSVVSAHSTTSPPSSPSIFSLFRSNNKDSRQNQHEIAYGLREALRTRRNDFLHAVNKLEIKSDNLIVDDMNDLCNLYREVIEEEPEPLQAL